MSPSELLEQVWAKVLRKWGISAQEYRYLPSTEKHIFLTEVINILDTDLE